MTVISSLHYPELSILNYPESTFQAPTPVVPTAIRDRDPPSDRHTWREQSSAALFGPSAGALPKCQPAPPFLFYGLTVSSHSGNPTASEKQQSKEAFVKPCRRYMQVWAVPGCRDPHPALLRTYPAQADNTKAKAFWAQEEHAKLQNPCLEQYSS